MNYTPDFFRYEEERFSGIGRKEWLQNLVYYCDRSLIDYQTTLNEYIAELQMLGVNVNVDGSITGGVTASSEGAIISGVGSVIAVIPGGFTQVIGGVLIVAGSFFSKLSVKEKGKRASDIVELAQNASSEAVAVGQYREKYVSEIFFYNALTFLICFFLIMIII